MEIANTSTESRGTPKIKPKIPKKSSCPCTPYQLLAIIIPFSILGLFTAIFLSVFLIKCKPNNSANNNEIDEFDNFTEYKANLSYATLTPKDGYDKIYIHLGGITEFAGYFFKFFKSNTTFIPKGTKIYYLSGKSRKTKYVEEKFLNIPVPSWFNVDTSGNLICQECNDQFEEDSVKKNSKLHSFLFAVIAFVIAIALAIELFFIWKYGCKIWKIMSRNGIYSQWLVIKPKAKTDNIKLEEEDSRQSTVEEISDEDTRRNPQLSKRPPRRNQ